jgi:hypothetical protein
MHEPRSSKVHRAIDQLRSAATAVIEHRDLVDEPLWRRLFDAPREAHLLESTRRFVAALDDLLITPVVELSPEDVDATRAEGKRVLERLEQRIDALSDPNDARPFSAAIYVISARLEEIAARVAKARG